MSKVSNSLLSWFPAVLPDNFNPGKIYSAAGETFDALSQLSSTASGRFVIASWVLSSLVTVVEANRCYESCLARTDSCTNTGKIGLSILFGPLGLFANTPCHTPLDCMIQCSGQP